jgi:lysyl-tRNA synthetase class 1
LAHQPKKYLKFLPPQVLRFLFVRTPITTHIDFNPSKETLFNLFDEYDRCFSAYFDKQEGKLPQGKQGEVMADFARIIELSKVFDLPKKRLYLPRFRTIYNLLLQKKDDLTSFFEGLKKDKLTKEEKTILEERIFYAKKLMEREEETTSKNNLNQATNFTLNNNQKKFLKTLKENLKKLETFEKETIQEAIKKTLKETGIPPKEAFQGFYFVLTGKPFGPKAVDLIVSIGERESG